MTHIYAIHLRKGNQHIHSQKLNPKPKSNSKDLSIKSFFINFFREIGNKLGFTSTHLIPSTHLINREIEPTNEISVSKYVAAGCIIEEEKEEVYSEVDEADVIEIDPNDFLKNELQGKIKALAGEICSLTPKNAICEKIMSFKREMSLLKDNDLIDKISDELIYIKTNINENRNHLSIKQFNKLEKDLHSLRSELNSIITNDQLHHNYESVLHDGPIVDKDYVSKKLEKIAVTEMISEIHVQNENTKNSNMTNARSKMNHPKGKRQEKPSPPPLSYVQHQMYSGLYDSQSYTTQNKGQKALANKKNYLATILQDKLLNSNSDNWHQNYLDKPLYKASEEEEFFDRAAAVESEYEDDYFILDKEIEKT